MKLRLARTMKWNIIDRVSTQVLYAVTGIVLARILTQEDFGLVGAVLVFQAFASLFVDSGFSSALIQRKAPTRIDYSTVLWFNIAMAIFIYVVLWFCAPLIADCFGGDRRIIPIARVMFLTFILNATAIVQTNRLMKQMEVGMIAAANAIGLVAGAVVGIALAIAGYGPWAIVWQSVALSLTKSAVLWATSRWRPLWQFSYSSLRSFFKVGTGVMLTSLLNTVFLNIYAFLIGNRTGLVPLGYYTQADKWSKMPVSSLSQVVTSSFLPVLSRYQDNPADFASATAKMNRFTAWALFPMVSVLIVTAIPIFHIFLGTKWDAAIALFCILLVRGIFTVLSGLYSNYILALGRSRLLVLTELLRDGAAVVAIVFTFSSLSFTTALDPCAGLRTFLWGQVAASAITWMATLCIAARLSRRPWFQFITDALPYLFVTAVSAAAAIAIGLIVANELMLLFLQLAAFLAIYLGINHLAGSRIQSDVLAYVRGRLSKP